MRQYTNKDQTAKLILIGMPKPRCLHDGVLAYNIGELIEMLPPIFTNKYKCDCYLNITHDSANWIIDYTVSGVKRPYIIVSEIEFIDALFSMILKLYETGFYDFETERYVY